VLAELQFVTGEKGKAVLTLEEAMALPGAMRYLADQLDDYRGQVSPDLLSYSSIDAALAATNRDGEAEGELLEAFRDAAQGDDAGDRLEYLEARVLGRRGDHAAAARKLKALVGRDPARPEPLLRFAESLRAAGDPASVERELRSALKHDDARGGDLWNLWAATGLVDLARSPAEMLSGLPDGSSGDACKGYCSDLRWLLETLKESETVRIDCGGEGCRSTQGVAWAEDRFFTGGKSASWSGVKVAGTRDEPLYLSARVFPADEYATPAYRIPLPGGVYQVTLHFAELAFQAPGRRSFDVHLEGTEVLKDHDLVAARGYAVAEIQTFRTDVGDGILDIEFVRRIDNPCVSAIEIERLE
jgi:tetratricopeptide (TPR) repeat protein